MSKHPYHERKVREVEAERDEARREIERLKERLEAKADAMDRLEAERDEARAEVARLQNLLLDSAPIVVTINQSDAVLES